MFLKQLTLKNFRQFNNETFVFNKPITIIRGDNSQGKTTILEAIYYLTNGFSPWTSINEDLISTEIKEDFEFFRLDAIINIDNIDFEYSVYNDNSRKKYLINKKTKNKNIYYSKICSTLFSPEQIELLMVSPQLRRDYLNDFISKYNNEYKDTLHLYNKVLRQRNRYLKKLQRFFFDTGLFNLEDQHLAIWTNKIAELGAEIIKERSLTCLELSEEKESIFVQYSPSIKLEQFDDLLDTNEIKTLLYKNIQEKLKTDIAIGFTNIGPHRDDWKIKTNKDVKRFGSRGEKRVAIGKLIFRSQDLLKEKLNFPPILLLDDISSELDDTNILNLLSNPTILNNQVFITTIRDLPVLKKIKDINYDTILL